MKPKKLKNRYIKPYSLKRQKENRKYSTLRKKYLINHPECQAQLSGCTYEATDVHHKAGRVGLNLLNVGTWLPVCRSCHNWIEDHPAEAKEKELSINRLT